MMNNIPEKWCILVTEDNENSLHTWYKENIEHYIDCSPEWRLGKERFFHYPQYSEGCHSTYKATFKEEYKEISFEEFEKYVMNKQPQELIPLIFN